MKLKDLLCTLLLLSIGLAMGMILGKNASQGLDEDFQRHMEVRDYQTQAVLDELHRDSN